MEETRFKSPKVRARSLTMLPEREKSSSHQYTQYTVSAEHTLSIDIIHPPSRFYHIFKRLMDIFFAILGLILLFPVFLVVAVSIKLDDGGDVFYLREIIGQHGKRFFALKFRTMCPDADVYLEQHPALKKQYLKNMKLMNDPRITRVGHFLRKASLDEFPQLVNVLLGQMSLVGPRIIHPSELARYKQFAQKRLSVLPGITGLWQISGRLHASYDERILLDMNYIDKRSSLGDLIILFKTLKVLVFHSGV
ncbi:MAG: hypothetical protein PVS3B1_39300 [Ktedonobacteraceae bacterium]